LSPAILAFAISLLATAFPSNSQTSWMRPDAFHLGIGMSRVDAMTALQEGGWEIKKGRNDDQVVVDYSNEKALTLEFNHSRLHAVRFELYAKIPEVQKAFDEQKEFLRKTLGESKSEVKSRSIVLYDHTLPNVMLVLSDDPKSDKGKLGLGFLAVRYYDPRPPKE
jgi:hypothetical protein